MAPRSNAAPVLTALPESIPRIFDQAQTSTANHQKNFVALNKIHHEAALVTEPTNAGRNIQLTGEKAFEDVFLELLLRILPLKKGATVVDRLVKFVAGYVKFLNEKDEKIIDQKDDDDDNTASRFVARLIKYLLKGFEAKDKVVRFRVLQIVADVISNLGEIDEDVYEELRTSLVVRVHDKEPLVRTQGVIALTKLLSPDNTDDSDQELMDVILDVLAHDPAAEVRKAALVNTPLNKLTLSAILSRTRDVDPTVRRLVYTPVLDKLEHPKQLSIAQRELVVRVGLKDREQTVSAAAGKLVASWVDALNGDILQFVRLFDFNVVHDQDGPAEQALLSVFKARPDIIDNLDFSDAFWDELTPEKAILARVFVEHCIQAKDEARIENCMPVMTALAFKIQALYNELLRLGQSEDESKTFGAAIDEDDAREETIANLQFVLIELMKLAINMDYADEIGRRKMFALVRDMISQEILPENMVSYCLDILRKLSASERDLIRIVVEVIHELRDTDTDEDDSREKSADNDMGVEETPMPSRTPARQRKPPTDMTVEEKERADSIDLRCLSLCIGMLERVNSSFEENSTLEGVLGELIIPAVKRKELPLREKGLVSLGLCCLIARRMALNSFQLFLKQLSSSPEALRIRVLQIVFDVMMVHEGDFLGNASVGGDRVVEFLTTLFEREETPKVQAVLCTGLAKLMLSGMVADEKVLKSLVLAYMSPETADNQEVRQCLSYFFPVYCYSSSANQRRMQQILLPTYEELSRMYNDLEEDEVMVTPLQATSLLVDWIDPQKAIDIPGMKKDKLIHFDLAVKLVKALLQKDLEKDDKKAFSQLLGKLYIPDEVDDDKVRTLKLLLNNVKSRRPLRDTTSANSLARFDGMIAKKFEAQLESFNEDEYRQLAELKDLFEFLDDIIPDDVEDEITQPKRAARKRRSESIATSTTATTAGEEEYRIAPEPRSKTTGKSKAKRRRTSKSDDSDQSDADADAERTPPAPTRSLPKRSARKAAPVMQTVPDSEDSEELHDEETEEESESEQYTPPPKSQFSRRPRSIGKRRTTEQQLDDEINELLEGHSSFVDDSFEGPEADGDDSEVDDLLDDS